MICMFSLRNHQIMINSTRKPTNTQNRLPVHLPITQTDAFQKRPHIFPQIIPRIPSGPLHSLGLELTKLVHHQTRHIIDIT